MNETSKAILKFLRKTDWNSPKEIEAEIYPLFKKEYTTDTFSRVVRRSLKELVDSKQIFKHELQPIYHHSDYISILNSKDTAESLSKYIDDFGIGELSLSRILSFPFTKIPIVKSALIEEERRKNLPFELKVLFDYIDGLSSIKIAKKYEEISNKNEALKVIRKGLGILIEEFKSKTDYQNIL